MGSPSRVQWSVLYEEPLADASGLGGRQARDPAPQTIYALAKLFLPV